MPSREQLLLEYDATIQRLAQAVLATYPRWCVDPLRQCAELQQAGKQRLLEIYKRIVFHRVGYRAFILRSMMGAMRNYMNKYVKELCREMPTADIFLLYDGADEPDTMERVKREIMEVMVACLETLPPKQRCLLMQKYRDGKTNSEIGQFYGIDRHEIPARLHAIIETCRSYIEQTQGWQVSTPDLQAYLEEAPDPLFIISRTKEA